MVQVAWFSWRCLLQCGDRSLREVQVARPWQHEVLCFEVAPSAVPPLGFLFVPGLMFFGSS